MLSLLYRRLKSSSSKICLTSLKGTLAFITFSVFALSPDFGQTADWTGSQSSDWNDGGNWDGNSVPAPNSTIIINSLDPLSRPATASGVTYVGTTFNIGNVANQYGTLFLTDGSDFTLNAANIGSAGTGSLYIIDSKLTASNTIAVGSGGGSQIGNGYLIISGSDANLSITNDSTHLNIGNNEGGYGHVEILDGATVNVWNISLGNQRGSGSLTVDGSGSILNIIGRDLSAAGKTGDVSIVVKNGGLINIEGAAESYGMLQLGSRGVTVTTLILTGDGSQITTTGEGRIGEFGTVQATVENQAELNIGSSLIVGYYNDSVGELAIDTQGQVTVAVDTLIGYGGHGTLTLSGESQLRTAGDILIGWAGPSTGVLNIGAAAGQTAATAGILDAPEIKFGAGAGKIVFNHTNTPDQAHYNFSSIISGNGTIEHHAGLTLLTATDNSNFTGSTGIYGGTLQVNGILGGEMTVDSLGRLRGTGTVGQTINRGTIAPGNSIGTLVIDGDYTGENGTLEIEVVLAGDASNSDLLRVLGSTYGHTNIKVINLGGHGAQTVNGIKVVDVRDASDGSFALESDDLFEGEKVVFAGAYGYRLYQHDIQTMEDGNWYLRSARTGDDPIYQPGAPVYETYGHILQNLNQLGTLRQRVGSRFRDATQDTMELGKSSHYMPDSNGIWGRIESSHSRFEPKYSTAGTEYTIDALKIQTGLDSILYETETARLVGGLTLHYGHANAEITSVHGKGAIRTDGYGFGGTLTWYDDSGFYADGQAQVAWYRSDLTTSLIDGNKGTGYALSIESGKRIPLNDQWSITPQAQLAYSHVNFDAFTDPINAYISLKRNESLQGRLGVAVDRQNQWRDNMGKYHRSQIYGIANIYYEFFGKNELTIDSVDFSSGNERIWGGAGIGGSYNWNDDHYSLYGEGSINTAFHNLGNSITYKGTVGIRVRW